MVKKYYLDTSIWMDVYENRLGYGNEAIGHSALKFLFDLLKGKSKVIITDMLVMELSKSYSLEQINGMFMPFRGVIEKVVVTGQQKEESKRIAKERNLPLGDVIHAVISRDNDLVLITRDNHFRKLQDICKHFRPEDLI